MWENWIPRTECSPAQSVFPRSYPENSWGESQEMSTGGVLFMLQINSSKAEKLARNSKNHDQRPLWCPARTT